VSAFAATRAQWREQSERSQLTREFVDLGVRPHQRAGNLSGDSTQIKNVQCAKNFGGPVGWGSGVVGT
jgi:hypothetical protein